jgi:membrane protein
MPDPETRVPSGPPGGVEAPLTSTSRLSGVRHWLSARADTSLPRLALLWFRSYFEASRNSGAAAAVYITLSVLPGALVVVAIFNLANGDESAFARRLNDHMNFDGATASLVTQLFGTTSNNILAASIAIVIGFLIWGLSIGQLYQDVYARAWRVKVGAASDQLRFVIYFFALSAVIGVAVVLASELRAWGLIAVVPVWVGGSMLFWLWTPRFLLHRQVPFRSLLPGAGMATFVLGGTIVTSPLWIGSTINQNARAFGSFGVVLGLLAYTLICVTISMVCAVFSPVWAEWRRSEAGLKKRSVAGSGN